MADNLRAREGENALLPKRKRINRAVDGLFAFATSPAKPHRQNRPASKTASPKKRRPSFFRPIANARLRERILCPRVHDIRPPPDRRSSKDLSFIAHQRIALLRRRHCALRAGAPHAVTRR